MREWDGRFYWSDNMQSGDFSKYPVEAYDPFWYSNRIRYSRWDPSWIRSRIETLKTDMRVPYKSGVEYWNARKQLYGWNAVMRKYREYYPDYLEERWKNGKKYFV